MALLSRGRPAGPRGRSWFLLVALLVGAATAPPAAAAPAANEVKAAFLCNFAEFVEWPAGHRDGGPVVIGILGEDPFGELIDQAAQARSLPAGEIQIRRLASAEEAAEVEILFVSDSEADHLHKILETLRYSAVLTVGDIPDFATTGGVIGLKVEDKRVRLEINVAAATRAGLVISSRLLNLAQLVEDGAGERD